MKEDPKECILLSLQLSKRQSQNILVGMHLKIAKTDIKEESHFPKSHGSYTSWRRVECVVRMGYIEAPGCCQGVTFYAGWLLHIYSH